MTRSFEIMVMSYFQLVRPQCKMENFYTTGTQKRIDANSVDGFCGHCNTVFQIMGCYYLYCWYQEALPFLTKEVIQRGFQKREPEELWKQYIQVKGYNVIEMYEGDWQKMYRTGDFDK